MLVLEIHDTVDTIMGVKNVYEIEGIISPRDSCLPFLNRSIPFLSRTDVLLKPMVKRLIKIGVSFIYEIFRLSMTKL